MKWLLDKLKFSSELRSVREARGWSQNETAKKIGISLQTYQKLEAADFGEDGKGLNLSVFITACNWVQIEPYRYFKIDYKKPDRV